MIASTITNDHVPPKSGWSLQVDPVMNLEVRYTPNEGVRSPDWVAPVSARSDCAVTNGGIAVDYLVELPGLGKSGDTIERPKLPH
eukprot:4229115-Pleurochrysis_carterae.AAC.1